MSTLEARLSALAKSVQYENPERLRDMHSKALRRAADFQHGTRMKFAASAPAPKYSQADNDRARAFVLSQAREMFQVTATSVPAAPIVGQVINIPLRNVGLCKRLLIEVTATVGPSANNETQSLTKWGLANFFSNINVTDLSNYQRVNTSGRHLYALACLRRQLAFGAAYLNDAPAALGSNLLVNNSPSVIGPAAGAKTVRFMYEIPFAYSDVDLRGAIYAAVVNATWNLQLTINPNFFVGNAGDPLLGAFQASTAAANGALTAVTINVHQIYLDQLPFQGSQPVLPWFDLATGYLITETNNVGLTVNQDFPIQYPNFRQILSTMVTYDQNGTQNPGTDLNSIGIQAANLVFLYKSDPFVVAHRTRNIIGDDLPPGSYFLESRMQPINTTAFGNMQIVLNPSSVAAGSNVLMSLEMFGVINEVANASSLAAS